MKYRQPFGCMSRSLHAIGHAGGVSEVSASSAGPDNSAGSAGSGGLVVRAGIVIPRGELSWRFSRSSGPGGQSVNTADSRVELRWAPARTAALPEPLKERAVGRLGGRLVNGSVVVTADEHRSQLRNRQAAETRLAALVADAIAPEPARRRRTKPTRGSVRARLEAKRRRGEVKRRRREIDD